MKIRYPSTAITNTACRQIVDPAHVNERFDEVARAINGGLTGESLCEGATILNARLQNPRSLVPLFFNYASDNALTHSATANLLTLPYDARLLGASTYGAIPAADIMLRTAAPLNLLRFYDANGAPEEFFWDQLLASPSIAAGQTLQLVWTAGSLQGLCVWLSMVHCL